MYKKNEGWCNTPRPLPMNKHPGYKVGPVSEILHTEVILQKYHYILYIMRSSTKYYAIRASPLNPLYIGVII